MTHNATGILPADQLTERILTGLEQINQATHQLLKDQAEEHGISILQLRILQYAGTERAGISPGHLARQFGLSKATVSVALRSLAQKGFIKKQKSRSDERSVQIFLTDWGGHIAHVTRFYNEPLRRIVQLIGGEDKQVLLRNIEGITVKLQERRL